MKLLSFRHLGEEKFGVLLGDAVLPLGGESDTRMRSLVDLIRIGDMGTIRRTLQNSADTIALADIEFLPLIGKPEKILCVGVNYEEHRVETKREATARPTIFARFAQSQVGHQAPMIRPPESIEFDFEGEIAIVIGKQGRRIPEAEAMSHVFGYSCYNDGSIRDWQRHTGQFHPGKNFDGTGAFGPYLLTADKVEDYRTLRLTTRLNGQTVQDALGGQMIFSIPEIIAYVSTFCTLVPGDVIVTGTPGGVGARRTPPLFMKPGDRVEVEVSGIGVLSNPIAE